MAGCEAVLEGGVDAAGGDGRDHAGCVADEKCPLGGHRLHDAAAGDGAGADGGRFAAAGVDDAGDFVEKLFHDAFHNVWIAGHPAGEADLGDADAGDHPADVAGGETAVEEAVEAVVGGEREAGEFVLDAEQEFAILAEGERFGNLPCWGSVGAAIADCQSHVVARHGNGYFDAMLVRIGWCVAGDGPALCNLQPRPDNSYSGKGRRL